MTEKYFRIQGREISHRTGKPVGVFAVCRRMIRDQILTTEEIQLFHNINVWFKETLPEPPFYRNNNLLGVITYFKSEEMEIMLNRIRPLLQLFDKYNLEYDIVYTNYVGKVLYEDKYQIAVVDWDSK